MKIKVVKIKFIDASENCPCCGIELTIGNNVIGRLLKQENVRSNDVCDTEVYGNFTRNGFYTPIFSDDEQNKYYTRFNCRECDANLVD